MIKIKNKMAKGKQVENDNMNPGLVYNTYV